MWGLRNPVSRISPSRRCRVADLPRSPGVRWGRMGGSELSRPSVGLFHPSQGLEPPSPRLLSRQPRDGPSRGPGKGRGSMSGRGLDSLWAGQGGVEGRACTESSVHRVKRCGDRAAALNGVATWGRVCQRVGAGLGPLYGVPPLRSSVRSTAPTFRPVPAFLCDSRRVPSSRGPCGARVYNVGTWARRWRRARKARTTASGKPVTRGGGVGAAEATFAFSGMPSWEGESRLGKNPRALPCPAPGWVWGCRRPSGVSGASTCE